MLVKILKCAIALMVVAIVPTFSAEAVPCRQIQGESVCIAEIKRSAKNHWEYRVSLQSGSHKSSIEIYNCRDRYRISSNGKAIAFEPDGVGNWICKTLPQ